MNDNCPWLRLTLPSLTIALLCSTAACASRVSVIDEGDAAVPVDTGTRDIGNQVTDTGTPPIDAGADAPTASPGTVTGTILGKTFPVGSAIGYYGPDVGGYQDELAAVILSVQDIPNMCSNLLSNYAYSSAQQLTLSVEEDTITAGQAYAFTAPGGDAGPLPYGPAIAQYQATDSTCGPDTIYMDAAGSVTFTTLGPTRVAGTFTLVFANGDHVDGSFDTPFCADWALLGTTDAGFSCVGP